MKTELSPAAERAVQSARTASAVEELDLVQLLTALIADDESRPAEVLANAGCRLADLREDLAALPARLTYQRKFLTLARETTTDHGEAVITGEYLLLTLLAIEPMWRTLIEGTGGNTEPLTRTVSPEVIRTEDPPSHNSFTDELPGSTQRRSDLTPAGINPAARPASATGSALRICDVNANRVREALRVLDDYARLVRNDCRLTEGIKALRHDFVAVLAAHPGLANLESRDTVGDVGTAITTPGERTRADVHDVARVNMKRLQEALRSLEEFGKVIDPAAAAKIEQIRYRSYTAERDLFVASQARQRLAAAQLYFLVSSAGCLHGFEETIRGAVAGGVSVVQLREKGCDDRTLYETATLVRRWTRETGALFIVNDRPDVAIAVEADGVHLGQDDLPITAVRRLVPPEMLIGVSTHTPAQLAEAVTAGADYVGVGPTFPSTTKTFERFAGLDFLRHAAGNCALPAFAIGGLNSDTVRQAVEVGATRVAVSAAISQADDLEKAARELLSALQPKR